MIYYMIVCLTLSVIELVSVFIPCLLGYFMEVKLSVLSDFPFGHLLPGF